VKESPGRRFANGQAGGGVFRNAGAGKRIARWTGGGVQTWTQPIDYSDRHQLHYFLPLLPAMETPQIVGAHDPDESDPRAASQQPGYRIVGVSRLNDSFEAGHIDPRVTGKRAHCVDPFAQGREIAGIFERITGGYQPPDTVELEPFEREQSRAEMRLVWRIKSSAEQADPHAGRVRRQEALGDGGFF